VFDAAVEGNVVNPAEVAAEAVVTRPENKLHVTTDPPGEQSGSRVDLIERPFWQPESDQRGKIGRRCHKLE